MRMILLFCGWLAFGQSTEAPAKFEIADVHLSAKTVNPFVRTGPVRGGRYEIKLATMVNLIHIAYGYDADKILGGPSWLEMDRFDVIAKVPEGTAPPTLKLMLQALLEDRFKLKLHKETRPLPTYALTAGKKPLLKPADDKEEPGCHPQSSSGPASENGVVLMLDNGNGGPVRINLGNDMMVRYQCRNMTMASFAEGLRDMFGADVGNNPVLDETGLKGAWNFDVKWSIKFIGIMAADAGPRISLSEAMEKQLGLKLEQRQVPTPVIVVDSCDEKPSANPPGVSEALPSTAPPTEFEVASVKLSDPGGRGGRFQMQPGGRLNAEGMALRFLINRAFNTNNREAVAGIPAWADTARFDIVAKAPSAGPSAPALDMESAAPMIRALLADRFKMTYHTEDRTVSAYALVSNKPKMKKADPTSRTSCKMGAPAPGAPPGSTMLTCQNISMAQFADRLQNMSQELNWPVLDSTGIEGGWDFALTYSRNAGMAMGRGGRGGDAPAGEMATAPEPTGALTLFEAVEKTARPEAGASQTHAARGRHRPSGTEADGELGHMKLTILLTLSLPLFSQTQVVAISHRGEHLVRPENTIPAFQEAIRVGADFFEADVRTTSDGKMVLSHDATVDRCTNGTGPVAEMTFAQIEALDAGIKKGPEFAGTRVPTFDEVLDLARGKIGVYVDIKHASAQDLVSHIVAHGMADHVVMYCSPNICRQIQELNPNLKLMPEADSVDHAKTVAEQLHLTVMAFDAGDFKPEIIAVAKQAHAKVYVDRMGATDAPDGWQAAIDAGADGIQTDRPGPLVEWLRQKRYKH